jgi:hypothetical protein
VLLGAMRTTKDGGGSTYWMCLGILLAFGADRDS